jgi:predicted nucleic acid-binding protein
MSGTRAFFDTNVLLHLFSQDAAKARQAETLLEGGGLASVQVLNEFVSVVRRKLDMSWADVREALDVFQSVLAVESLTAEAQHKAVEIAETHRLNIYDAQILASALAADCPIVYSEDMHAGLQLEGSTTVTNPFV